MLIQPYMRVGPLKVRPTVGMLMMWSAWRLLRWLLRLITTTAQVWWAGTGEIFGWLQDKGELSRADGLRVLAAGIYVGSCYLALFLIVFNIMRWLLP